MLEVYDAEYVSLHVRRSNRAALTLYRDTLGFTYVDNAHVDVTNHVNFYLGSMQLKLDTMQMEKMRLQ